MDELETGVTEDSPSSTTAATADTSAGTKNTDTTQPGATATTPREQFVPYARFQEVNGRAKTLETTVGQLTQRLEAFERKAQGPGLTDEQRFEYQKAGNALKSVIAEHPELKGLLKLAEHAETLLQGHQTVGQLNKAQQQTATRQGVAHIANLAKSAGMTEPQQLKRIEHLVAAEVASNPELAQRYISGDLSALDDAFKAVDSDFLGHMRRQAQTTVLDTKNKTRQLPPVSRGGAPGADAPPTLKPEDRGNPDKVRAYERSLGEQAKATLRRLVPGG